ncbi:MAG: hypothetical protein C4555_02570 [Dehalococcoidia bacterium]|jgi:sirohydrochlorin ferrochelatase|nr:MAG: hypothetical protein C4555_02570 [Dehalococcoidia bacterium]
MVSTNEIGVLVVTHGGTLTEQWGELFLEAVQKAEIPCPTRVVWLVKGKFALPTLSPRVRSLIGGELGKALAAFESENINKIVVVPFYLFSQGQEQDRIRYTLGLKPLPPSETGLAGFGRGGVLKHRAKIVMTPGMDNHPLIIGIILERATELSRKPENDAVVIIAKRPGAESLEQIRRKMDMLADSMKVGGGFKDVGYGFIMEVKRTYLPDAVGDEEAKNTREIISRLKTKVSGNVIVLPLFLSDGIMNRLEIPRLIEGLECLYDPRPFLPHGNVSRWIKQMAQEGIKEFAAQNSQPIKTERSITRGKISS